MTKISSKSVYPKKNPISDDYFVGTDSENFGKTVNFGFEATAGLINKLNGTPILNYVFNTSPYIDTEVLVEGQFLSLASELNTPELTKLYVNKFNNSGDNLGELYLFLKDNATDFYLKLRNSNNQNNVVYFNIASIESFQDYFILNISVFKENEFFPLLENLNVYFFDFELKAVSAGSDPLKLDKSTYTGNAQDLDTRIDALENLPTASVITSETGFSLVELNFTINALWEWILNNANYSNPAPVIIPISLCAAGKKRISYIVPNNTNGFSLINGVETTGIPTAPSIPNKGMYVSFFIVTDSLIDTPSEPNVGSIPSLEDVIRTSPFTTLPFTIQEKLSDTSSNSGLYLHSRYLSLWNWLAGVANYVSIKWDNIGVGTVYQLPNKPNSSTQTFAMLSDIVTDTSKENIANKSQDVETDKLSITKYPSVKGLYDWAVGKFQLALGFTPANDANVLHTTGDETKNGSLTVNHTSEEYGFGVKGTSINGNGVQGESTNLTGVLGISTNFTGVLGVSTGGVGVNGASTDYIGVLGESTDYIGVQGNSTNGTGVYGYSETGLAGYFDTNLGTKIVSFATAGIEQAYILATGLFKANRILVNTDIDNEVDALQVDGTISATEATTANQVVIKSQLDAKANLPIKVLNITVANTGWTLVSGIYEKNVTDSNILTTSIVYIVPKNSTLNIVQNAEVFPEVLSNAGSVTIYAKFIPTASFDINLNIFN